MDFDDPTFGALPQYLTNPDEPTGYGGTAENEWVRANAERMVIMPDGSVWGIVGAQASSWAVDQSTGKPAAPFSILYLYDTTGQRPSPIRGAEPSHPDYVAGVTALRSDGRVVSIEEGTSFAANRRTGGADDGSAGGGGGGGKRGRGGSAGVIGRGAGAPGGGRPPSVTSPGRGERAAGAKLPDTTALAPASGGLPGWAIPVGLIAIVGAYLGYRYYKARKMRAAFGGLNAQ